MAMVLVTVRIWVNCLDHSAKWPWELQATLMMTFQLTVQIWEPCLDPSGIARLSDVYGGFESRAIEVQTIPPVLDRGDFIFGLILGALASNQQQSVTRQSRRS